MYNFDLPCGACADVVFVHDNFTIASVHADALALSFFDDDDPPRFAELRELLASPAIALEASSSDERAPDGGPLFTKIYLHTPASENPRGLFAFTVLRRGHFEAECDRIGYCRLGASAQIGDDSTDEGLRAAFTLWLGRLFPEIAKAPRDIMVTRR